MVTTDEPPFTLAERARGANTVIVGRIDDRISTTVSESEPIAVEDEMNNDPGRTVPQVISTYEVMVEEVLVGEFENERIRVRVLGGRTDNVETEPTVQLEEGERFAMFLVPDTGPEADDRVFVPYFDGAYHIEDDIVGLPEDLATELRETLDVDEPTVDELSEFVEREVRDLKAWDDRLVDSEPDEQRKQPYPAIDEQPELEAEGIEPIDTEPNDRDDRQR